MKLSDAQRKALEILRDHGPIRPREFAHFMWPDSDCWTHRTKVGNGVTVGGGMNLAAGGFLGKLRMKKYARWSGYGSRAGYVLTREGREALKENERN